MKRLIVDSSVVVKWFVPEVHSVDSLRLLEGAYDLWAPELLLSEVGNVLWKKCRLGEIDAGQAAEVLRDLRRSAIEVQPVSPLLGLAWQIAVQYQRTFYDSVYLALAVHEGARLVTADKRLSNALLQTPLAGNVLWVGDTP